MLVRELVYSPGRHGNRHFIVPVKPEISPPDLQASASIDRVFILSPPDVRPSTRPDRGGNVPSRSFNALRRYPVKDTFPLIDLPSLFRTCHAGSSWRLESMSLASVKCRIRCKVQKSTIVITGILLRTLVPQFLSHTGDPIGEPTGIYRATIPDISIAETRSIQLLTRREYA